MKLKGIDKQTDIGMLSIYEAYNYIIVGTNVKMP